VNARPGTDDSGQNTKVGAGLGWCRRHWVWLAVPAVVVCAGAVRIRLAGVPLERDEGEYAYAGQLILEGIPPYAKVYNMKLPGIYAAYALVLAVFGQTHVGIHLGLLVVNGATIVLVFLLGKKLIGPVTGAVAAAGFAIMSVSQSVQGVFANAEHFVLLPALGGLVVLLYAIEAEKRVSLFWSGLLLGTGFVMKQHGAAFIAFAGMYLLWKELERRPVDWDRCTRRCGLFVLGAAVPFGATCLILLGAGVFDRFWFWTFDYARRYVASVPVGIGLRSLGPKLFSVAGPSVLVWALALVGLVSPVWDKRARATTVFVTAFFLFSFLSVCPGFYFRPHYFVLLLPAVALAAGAAVSSIADLVSYVKSAAVKTGVPALVILIAVGHSVYAQRTYLFTMSPTMVARTTYGANPFPESIEIARYIRNHSSPEDTVAVIGSEPQIYFYSGRRSATGHVYTYALMETHEYAAKMQLEMINEIEAARPMFLVLVNVPTSWLVRPDSNRLIFRWIDRYSTDHYTQVGLVDILSADHTAYYWDEKVADRTPQSRAWLAVFQRRQ